MPIYFENHMNKYTKQYQVHHTHKRILVTTNNGVLLDITKIIDNHSKISAVKVASNIPEMLKNENVHIYINTVYKYDAFSMYNAYAVQHTFIIGFNHKSLFLHTSSTQGKN